MKVFAVDRTSDAVAPAKRYRELRLNHSQDYVTLGIAVAATGNCKMTVKIEPSQARRIAATLVAMADGAEKWSP